PTNVFFSDYVNRLGPRPYVRAAFEVVAAGRDRVPSASRGATALFGQLGLRAGCENVREELQYTRILTNFVGSNATHSYDI
ncbi:MAG: hypothetical protein K2L35_08925, partial [Muribaculaceae bacterium]|nr:hypothetical protein [Muribaculaceae bacterium]